MIPTGLGISTVDYFGRSIETSTDGGTIVAGATYSSPAGFAAIYRRDPGGWVLNATIYTATNTRDFADSVAVSGNGMVVAIGDGNGASGKGAAHVSVPSILVSATRRGRKIVTPLCAASARRPTSGTERPGTGPSWPILTRPPVGTLAAAWLSRETATPLSSLPQGTAHPLSTSIPASTRRLLGAPPPASPPRQSRALSGETAKHSPSTRMALRSSRASNTPTLLITQAMWSSSSLTGLRGSRPRSSMSLAYTRLLRRWWPSRPMLPRSWSASMAPTPST